MAQFHWENFHRTYWWKGRKTDCAKMSRKRMESFLVTVVFLTILLCYVSGSEHGHFISCHRIFAKSEGVILSPNYPNDYPLSHHCVYDVARPTHDICGIRLTFEYFELEPPDPYDGFCKKDWVAIDSCVPEGGARFCGNQTGATYEYPFHQSADAFRLIFHSGNSSAQPGHMFKIQYKVMKTCGNAIYWDPPISSIPAPYSTATVPCFTQVTERKGSINSPFFPHKYPANLDCVYEFIRESPFTCGVHMRVLTFDLDYPEQTQLGGACLDFFHSPGCGFICGNIRFSWIAKFQPGATSLKFHFHSDESVERSGFKISFEQLFDCTQHNFPQHQFNNYYSRTNLFQAIG